MRVKGKIGTMGQFYAFKVFLVMATHRAAYNKKYYENKEKIMKHLKEKRMSEICNRVYALNQLSEPG